MIDIRSRNYTPTAEEIGAYIGNPVFLQFCREVMERYRCREQLDFSSCSWEYGWNVKFKKSGKTLCTIYPRENYFTVLVVVGKQEKDAVEAALPTWNPILREIYRQTKEGNGQRWLMIDLEDKDDMYSDTFHLLDIRGSRQIKRTQQET